MRKEIKEGLEAERVAAFHKELTVIFKAEWSDDEKAAIRKQVQDEHHEMRSQIGSTRV